MEEQAKYKLSEAVMSEVELLEMFNVELPTLNVLRLEKGFPVVPLSRTCRVYLTEDVLSWLKEHRRTH